MLNGFQDFFSRLFDPAEDEESSSSRRRNSRRGRSVPSTATGSAAPALEPFTMSRERLGSSFFYNGSVFANENIRQSLNSGDSEIEPRRVYEDVEGSELEARAGSYDVEGSELWAWEEEGSQLEGSEIEGRPYLEESEIAERPWLFQRGFLNWEAEESEIASHSEIAERLAPPAPPPVAQTPQQQQQLQLQQQQLQQQQQQQQVRAPVSGQFQLMQPPPAVQQLQPAQPPPVPKPRPYQPFPQDPIDLHVADYFRKHPEVHAKYPILRRQNGLYELNGRLIRVELQFIREQTGQQRALLIVVDGPLRQPFADYMEMKDSTAEYSGSVFVAKNSLQQLPKSARLTFKDDNNGYSRVEAMKVAKEQAIVREKAATMMSQGQYVVPAELNAKYMRTISMKLGKNPQQPVFPLRGMSSP